MSVSQLCVRHIVQTSRNIYHSETHSLALDWLGTKPRAGTMYHHSGWSIGLTRPRLERHSSHPANQPNQMRSPMEPLAPAASPVSSDSGTITTKVTSKSR